MGPDRIESVCSGRSNVGIFIYGCTGEEEPCFHEGPVDEVSQTFEAVGGRSDGAHSDQVVQRFGLGGVLPPALGERHRLP